jgi:hypothetical protein
MTAEVVIMNKNAVAIAADSAATLNISGKDKISNTSNKVFRLLKNAPIGVLVYQNSRINGIPWEVIIKEYRRQNVETKYDLLKEYADGFLEYLERSDVNNSDSELIYVNGLIQIVNDSINKAVQQKIQELVGNNDGNLTQAIVLEELRQLLANIQSGIERSKNYDTITDDDITNITSLYGKHVFDTINKINQNVDKLLLPIIHDIIIKCLYKKTDIVSYSGIVFTGYGEKEYYPALESYKIYGIIASKVLLEKNGSFKITHSEEVNIIPFAQRDVVDTFIMGINPDFKTFIKTTIRERIENSIKAIIESDFVKNEIANPLLNQLVSDVIGQFGQNINDCIDNGSNIGVQDIMSAAKHLSIPELSNMAKNLVELTSFRKKVTLDTETVGGPVDVAIISKGDGFIWVERKHYFKKEYNEHFFDGYSRR